MMTPSQAQNKLKTQVDQLASPVTSQLIDVMAAFYRDQRIEGVDLGADGDMLLFQWGTYDWGEGENFEIDIVRQFLDPEEDEPKQLHLLMKFPPSDANKKLGDGNEWCESPEGLNSFLHFVRSCKAHKALQNTTPASIEVDFEEC